MRKFGSAGPIQSVERLRLRPAGMACGARVFAAGPYADLDG